MAAKKSAKYPYRWPDGSWHSRPHGGQYRSTAKKTVTLARPPAGTYDPALDAQERAAGRGLADLIADLERTGGYQTSDWMLGQQDIERQRREFGEDIATERQGVEREYGRSLADLLTERKQTTEDFGRATRELRRQFQVLGTQQAGQQRAAGVAAGGAVAAAAAKRVAAEGRERAPMDIAQRRFTEASALQQQRLGENRQLSLDALLRAQQRGEAEVGRGGGELNLGYQRGTEERNVERQRAGREYQEYLQDVAAARQAQYGGPMTFTTRAPTAIPRLRSGQTARQRARQIKRVRRRL